MHYQALDNPRQKKKKEEEEKEEVPEDKILREERGSSSGANTPKKRGLNLSSESVQTNVLREGGNKFVDRGEPGRILCIGRSKGDKKT